jgi:hypothetical protein
MTADEIPPQPKTRVHTVYFLPGKKYGTARTSADEVFPVLHVLSPRSSSSVITFALDDDDGETVRLFSLRSCDTRPDAGMS